MKTKKSRNQYFIPDAGLKIMGALLLLAIWQLSTSLGLININLFPSPLMVFHAFMKYASSGHLIGDLNASIWNVLIGFVIGVSIGIAAGLLTGKTKLWNYLLSPTLHFIRTLPPVAIIPLFILWFGINDSAKIITITFGSFFPVWLSTHTGVTQIPESYLLSAKLLTRSRLKILFRVVLPASLPHIFSGVRLSVATAFIMVFVSELAASNIGLGYRISLTQMAYKTDSMIAALCVLALSAGVVDKIITLLFNRLFPWLNKT